MATEGWMRHGLERGQEVGHPLQYLQLHGMLHSRCTRLGCLRRAIDSAAICGLLKEVRARLLTLHEDVWTRSPITDHLGGLQKRSRFAVSFFHHLPHVVPCEGGLGAR